MWNNSSSLKKGTFKWKEPEAGNSLKLPFSLIGVGGLKTKAQLRRAKSGSQQHRFKKGYKKQWGKPA